MPRILTFTTLLAALTIAACGSSDKKSGAETSSTGSGTVVLTTTTKSGATKTTTTKIPPPGKVTTVQAKTPQARAFVTRISGRCAAVFAATRSIAAPTGTVASGRTYARRAAGPITRAVTILRSSHPPKDQVVAVTSLLASYGQTRPLLRTLLVQKGAQRQLAPTAAKQLPPALKRVRIYAKAAALKSCRPPGL